MHPHLAHRSSVSPLGFAAYPRQQFAMAASQSSWVSFHVYAYQNYRSFDVTANMIDQTRVEAAKTAIMDLIGNMRPKNCTPAFCFEISPGEWHDLPGHALLSLLFKPGARVNVYLLWDPALPVSTGT